jgi:outer membrane PBP1 activator LpoA protein
MGLRRATLELGGPLAVLLLAVALAGCGGGSSSSAATSSGRTAEATSASSTATSAQTSSTGASAARGRFVLQAETICSRAQSELNAVKLPDRVTFAEIVRIAPAHASTERRAVSALDRLTPPAALAQEWRQVVAARRKLAEILTEVVAAARRKDLAKIEALSASKERERHVLAASAKRVRLRACGEVI